MGKIQIGKGDLLTFEVHPNIHFSKVAQWKDPEVFTWPLEPIVQVPKFRTLIFGFPLAKFIAV